MDPTPPARIRVLLVEDDAYVRDTLSRHLSEEFDVDCAADGRQAVARLSGATALDVCILDWRLPEVSGLDVLRWIARAAPAMLARTILLTGTYYDAGIDPAWPVARLIKPVSPALLALLVRRVATGTSAADAAADLI